eukprot:4115824-Amphidinium_carterae.2
MCGLGKTCIGAQHLSSAMCAAEEVPRRGKREFNATRQVMAHSHRIYKLGGHKGQPWEPRA